MDMQTEAMNCVPVSEDELQKKEEKNKQKHQASSFIIGFMTEDRVSEMNKSMSSHANIRFTIKYQFRLTTARDS